MIHQSRRTSAGFAEKVFIGVFERIGDDAILQSPCQTQ
jgi:hypothetical protein